MLTYPVTRLLNILVYLAPALCKLSTMNNNLGLFIKKNRERLRPEDVGLKPVGRRRTPGLRREELAQLCSISPTWITWIEQGRPVSASAAMLDRLSTALQLTSSERKYLFTLAGKLDPVGEDSQLDGFEAVLESVSYISAPSYILDRQWNVLAWNKPAEALFEGWLDIKEAPVTPNLLRFTFLAPESKLLIDNWPYRARRLVAEFRADCGLHVDDSEVRNLILELSEASKEFAMYWQDYNVMEREGGLRTFHHKTYGKLSFRQTTFYPATRRDMKLVVLLNKKS